MYKRKLFLIVIGFLFSVTIGAQNKFKIGVNAGLNYPDHRGYEYAKNRKFKIGYLLGVSFDYYLKEDLSIKANINYERKNRERELTYFNYDAEEVGDESFSEIYEYINVPLLLKYEFGKSKFFINGGPFFNYLLNNKLDSNYPNDSNDEITEQKKIDLGLSFGVGTNIALNESNDLVVEIRDDFGVIDIGGVPNHLDGTVKTNTIKLIIGWNLGI
ncbi:porin family protein [Winogradskyella sp. SYSU M77433]|uniref:porin family protein n=1 Tax=Winogradskyella sp. SYSU M77433 TaxID=3042722 RepID=UPI002480775A|nr:porin family protein [Winogradskyella sp. SYSU M77433]MDH7913992.1 porin family protein [Winogradskyella sp. SYSU M77433]